MAGRLLVRGMVAGILAACLAFLFARIFGEPQVNLAIAFESARDAAAGEAPEPELVSRTVQASFGLLTASIMCGAAYGGIFATAFSVAYGRIGRLSPRALSVLLAGLGFIVFALIPDLKYPPNPPAVGNGATIGLRTTVYFEMIALSVGAGAIAVLLCALLIRKLGQWNGILASIALFIAVIAVAQWRLPDINEVPTDFPAVVLWRFRESSIGMQAVLWTTLGLVFGPMAERVLSSSLGRTPRRSH
ncbi:CbtA family protein [Gluconobacter sp. Dm-62]|uniref:CbtA family protein n=1 Tax=Gluconobacter sp. Dm-62 TaxID=2799804 RepID=UPI001B8D555B|nr:CbtA family protein [Gluconobacter sp. Dm-62]MBS1103592.1 CbtA family protein [Gluconobacter sp. Dm-62]